MARVVNWLHGAYVSAATHIQNGIDAVGSRVFGQGWYGFKAVVKSVWDNPVFQAAMLLLDWEAVLPAKLLKMLGGLAIIGYLDLPVDLYIGYKEGKAVYVGITAWFDVRKAYWLWKEEMTIVKKVIGLPRMEARALEELIFINNRAKFFNKNHPIRTSHPLYNYWQEWASEYARRHRVWIHW